MFEKPVHFQVRQEGLLEANLENGIIAKVYLKGMEEPSVLILSDGKKSLQENITGILENWTITDK